MKSHDFSKSLTCPETKLEVPKKFLQFEPIWLVTVGFSGHGKSVYLASLTLLLEEIGAVWPDAGVTYLDSYTFQSVKQIRYHAAINTQPPPNPVDASPRPLLIQIKGAPNLTTRNIALYDVSGELFTDPHEFQNYVNVFSKVETVWFFISLKDLAEQTNVNTIPDLAHAYINAMEHLNAPMKGRNLVVVYTKADQFNFPHTIDQYTRTDPLRDLTNRSADILPGPENFEWTTYTKELQGISEQLRDFTQKQRGGASLIGLAKSEGMRVEFSVTSALGTAPNDDLMSVEATRFRVIDPFVWTLLLDGTNIPPDSDNGVEVGGKSIAFLIDGTEMGEEVLSLFQKNIPQKLFEALDRAGIPIKTYFIGQTAITSHPGQMPPTRPPRKARVPLIGPILETLKDSQTYIVIFSDGHIYDLNDFRDTSWLRRTIIVTQDQQDTEWEQFTYQSESDIQPLVDAIKRIIQ